MAKKIVIRDGETVIELYFPSAVYLRNAIDRAIRSTMAIVVIDLNNPDKEAEYKTEWDYARYSRE